MSKLAKEYSFRWTALITAGLFIAGILQISAYIVIDQVNSPLEGFTK